MTFEVKSGLLDYGTINTFFFANMCQSLQSWSQTSEKDLTVWKVFEHPDYSRTFQAPKNVQRGPIFPADSENRNAAVGD